LRLDAGGARRQSPRPAPPRPGGARVTVSTIEEYRQKPIKERVSRMARTPDEIAEAIRGVGDAILSRRPEDASWSAKEIVCHLRDVEREYIHRFHLVLDNDDPKIYLEPDSNG